VIADEGPRSAVMPALDAFLLFPYTPHTLSDLTGPD